VLPPGAWDKTSLQHGCNTAVDTRSAAILDVRRVGRPDSESSPRRRQVRSPGSTPSSSRPLRQRAKGPLRRVDTVGTPVDTHLSSVQLLGVRIDPGRSLQRVERSLIGSSLLMGVRQREPVCRGHESGDRLEFSHPKPIAVGDQVARVQRCSSLERSFDASSAGLRTARQESARGSRGRPRTRRQPTGIDCRSGPTIEDRERPTPRGGDHADSSRRSRTAGSPCSGLPRAKRASTTASVVPPSGWQQNQARSSAP